MYITNRAYHPSPRSIILSFLLLISLAGVAHESRPVFLEIIETQKGLFEVQYKIPSSIPEFNLPTVSFSKEFKAAGQPVMYRISDGFIKKVTLQSAGTLNDALIRINYPVANPPVYTIIRLSLFNGQKFYKLLRPTELEWIVPEQESAFGVAKQYTILGIQHILEGWDHLLFLVCLILVAGTGRKMLITITGFTLAHSITLVLSTLNLISLPIAPVEAVIALSVVFLATEIAVNNKKSLTYRFPIAVSSSFGLLHGFGFAAVLKDIGLPQTEVPVSLLFFNVGVEIGQIIFLFAVIVVFEKLILRSNFLSRILVWDPRKLEKLIAYGVGSISSFWLIQRLYGIMIY